MNEPGPSEVTIQGPPPRSVTPQGGQAPLQHDVAFSDDLEKLALRSAWLPTCSSPQSEHFNI